MKPSEDKLHKQVIDFIREVTGLSLKTINTVIGLYNLFLCSELSRGRTMSLKGLLSLVPYRGKAPQVRTLLSGPLKKAMYLEETQQGKKTNKLREEIVEIPQPVTRYLNPNTEEERAIVEEISTYAVLSGYDTNDDLKVNKRRIKSSLLGYLAHDFVYGQHWTHPLSGEVYPRSDIAKALLYLRNVSPNMYALIYSLWLGTDNRRRLYKKLEIRNEEVVELSNQAIDSLVMSITHPGFVPACLKNIAIWQAEWNQMNDHNEFVKKGTKITYRGVQ